MHKENAEHIERGTTVLKKEKRTHLRAQVLLICCITYKQQVAERKEKQLVRQKKVSETQQCALHLCFHGTSLCICFHSNNRLEEEGIDRAGQDVLGSSGKRIRGQGSS